MQPKSHLHKSFSMPIATQAMSHTLPLLIVLLAAAVSSPAAAAPHTPSNYWPDHRQLSKVETQNPSAPSTAFTYVALEDNDALCLDGSHYGYFICRAGDERWEINLQGGGWCASLLKQNNKPLLINSSQVLQRNGVP